MSLLSQFIGGGGIKSIQRGAVNGPNNPNADDLTISPVNMDKAIVLLQARFADDTPLGELAYLGVIAYLTSSTNLRLEHGILWGGGSHPSYWARWQVVEFY